MGLGLGTGSALATRSPKRIWHGAIGGFLGGFIGGFVFDMISAAVPNIADTAQTPEVRDVGGPSRLVGFTAIGALTGLFIGLVDELFKQAWVKVLAGRNEGKDFILSKPMNLLGRDERCDVPLYGDIAVGVQHAAIRTDGKRHVLMDGKTPTGTIVNGQSVPSGGEILLRDGDMIQIGAHRVLFREKSTASKVGRPVSDVPGGRPVSASMQVPSHLCPYCGGPKDSYGNCRCTLPVSVAASGPPQFDAGAPMWNSGAETRPDAGHFPAGPADGGFQQGAARLVGVEGPYTGQVFAFTGPNMTVGREMDRDVVLSADTTISRNHALLSNEEAGIVVHDAGSSNGTYVNGLRVSSPIALAPGDVVQFGSSKFRIE
jgi:pSer/pThr/pTyr-binding forkhead associated (FHA) protein